MGLFDRRSDKDLERNGLPGTAVVKSRRSLSGADEDPLDNLLVRSARHRIALEVHVDGREAYQVEDTYKVPRKYWKIATGVELPVRVDSQQPERVWIDWDAFTAAGGQKIVDDLGDQYRRDAVRDAVGQNPVNRDASAGLVESWTRAVKAGAMKREDFDRYIDERVSFGFLTPEEAEAAKRGVD